MFINYQSNLLPGELKWHCIFYDSCFTHEDDFAENRLVPTFVKVYSSKHLYILKNLYYAYRSLKLDGPRYTQVIQDENYFYKHYTSNIVPSKLGFVQFPYHQFYNTLLYQIPILYKYPHAFIK